MSKTARVQKPTQSAATRLEKQGVLQAVRACENKKAADIALLEIKKGTSAFTDYFVICSAASERQINAIRDDLVGELRDTAHRRPLRSEGTASSGWVLLDYGDVIVHIFAPEEREYYQLEDLWIDAPAVVRVQ